MPPEAGEKPRKVRKGRKRALLYLMPIVLVVGVSVLAGLHFASKTTIRDAEVRGLSMQPIGPVNMLLEQVHGVRADSVDMLGLIGEIESLPYIKEARVHVTPTGKMIANVTERSPMAILLNGNVMMLVDADGVRMPLPEGNLPDLPLLYGFGMEPSIGEQKAFDQTAAFLTSLGTNPVRWKSVSEVGWHPELGVMALSRENGVRLVFGSGDYDRKLAHWMEFYRQVVPVRGMASFTSLDFRFRNQIVAMES